MPNRFLPLVLCAAVLGLSVHAATEPAGPPPAAPKTEAKPAVAESAKPAADAKAAPHQSPEPAHPAYGPLKPGTADVICVVPVHGPMMGDTPMLYTFRRALKNAEERQARVIILDINTPGGDMEVMKEMIALVEASKVPVFAYVNKEAESAGAILSLATKRIFMAPGGSIGSALPITAGPNGVQALEGDIKEKMLSYARSLVRSLAQQNGHSEDVAMAMVDPAWEVRVGERVVNDDQHLLNLTSKEAVEIIPPWTKPLLAEAEITDVPALARHLGLENATIIPYEESAAERLARMICAIGPALLAIGLLLLYIEFKMPGVILPGIIGGACLAVYFFGHHVAGLAGMEDILLVVAGLILIVVEVFVFPTVGALAVLGILCVAAGLVLGLIPHIPDIPALPDLKVSVADYLYHAMLKLSLTGGIMLAGVWILSKLLPKTPLYGALVLQKELTQKDGFVSHTASRYAELTGRTGNAVTLLRPAGIAEIGDERCDVVSSGEFIPAGARVRVIRVEGSRIVVEADNSKSGT
jgi:membrane-bound serine protease (ClpP class)